MNRFYFKKTKTQWNDPPAVVPPPPPPPAVPPTSPPPGTPRMFTQEEVNRIQADNKRALQQQNAELAAQLTQLRESASLTQQERDALDSRITALNQQHLTETQKLTYQVESLTKAHKADVEAWSGKYAETTSRFHNVLIENAVAVAATEHKAASLTQMNLLLKPQSKVVEQKDKDGNPTGQFIAVIPTPMMDAKTKQVTVVDLPVADAVANLRKNPEFANLFFVEGSGGVGGVGNPGSNNSGGTPNFANMTEAEYRDYRKKEGMAKTNK